MKGRDITGLVAGSFVIDTFDVDLEVLRSDHPAVFQRLIEMVKPERDQNQRAPIREKWWKHGWERPALRIALKNLDRYIATPETSKHRVFAFIDADTLPDNMISAILTSDAFFLGVLSSRVHGHWSLSSGGTLEDRPRYTKLGCFDPFPFPVCASEIADRIRQLGEQLDAHRKRQQAAHPGLTITGMYNVLEKLRAGAELSAKERVIHEQGLVSVLKQIHDELDAAVFEAYGWPVTLTDEEILERLVALNHERAEEEKRGLVRWLRPEFQNPQGKKDAVQDEIPGTGQKKVKKGAKAASPAKAEKRAWPKELPQQVAAVRDLLAEAGALDLLRAKAAFKGAKDDGLAASLDSLAALGLAVASGAGPARSWSAVR
jgi:hypothetical protein